jgi:sugar lactone lactonase YvrE
VNGSRIELVKDGFGYLEAARWSRGALWFSDIKQKRIHRMSPTGETATVATIPTTPSGLGFAPDGSVLAVSLDDSKLWRFSGGELKEVADLSSLAFHTNDMAVDRQGRAYVTQFGYDLFGGAAPMPCGLVVVQPDGTAVVSGEGLIFPNGVAISADGGTLVVAESFGYRLSAFDLRSADGLLGRKRIFADFGDPNVDVVDGICMDAAGGVWVGCPFAGEFRRVVEGGRVTDRIVPEVGGRYCVACALGGEDLRTLYLLVADTDVERLGKGWDSTASVQAVRVEVPGFPVPGS